MQNKSLLGLRFGRLTVLEELAERQTGKKLWRCVCDCGNETRSTTGNLKSGKSSSCGCYRRDRTVECLSTHKMSRSREYAIWVGMHNRCRWNGHTNYQNYGGRGIRVCERWADFQSFYDDMGPCPSGLTIERINVDGDYTPENCKWETKTEQQYNKSTTRWIVYKGERMAVGKTVHLVGDIVSISVALHRLTRGWSVDDALTHPLVSPRAKRRGVARNRQSSP